MSQKPMMVSTRIVLLLISFVFLSNCGLFGEGPKVKYPNKVTPEMQADFQAAERAFTAKNYSQAKSSFQAYISKYPYNRLTDQAQYRVGQVQMLGQEYGLAAGTFAALARKTPDPNVKSRALVKEGISQYRVKDNAAALAAFSQVDGNYLRQHDKIKAGGLALAILDQQNASLERKAYYDALLLDGYQGQTDAQLQKKYRSEAPPRSRILNDLDSWAQTTAALSQIDRRFAKYKAGPSSPYINYKLGVANYQAGNEKQAKQYLGTLVSRYPNSSLAGKAQSILSRIGYRPKDRDGDVIKIGVILPLSGKYEQFGKSTLQGMECAAGARAGCNSLNNVQLISRDDGGSPAAAVQAVEQLVQRDNVVAIVGPLSSASALAAAKRAQALGVPMISLAQKEGIPQVGTEIFRFSLTPDQQIKTLLAYATKKRGKKSLGVLYPKNNYGQVFMRKFKSTAPAYGAKVTATQAYNNSSNVADDLRNLKFSVSKASPDSPLGFNALFVPDSYRAVLNIIPQLKMSGLETMLLLGTNAWNDPNLARGATGEVGDVVFLDIYFNGSNKSEVKDFLREFQAAYGKTPSTLEAMGYDVIRFISKMAEKNRIKNRREFRSTLLGIGNYDGITGLKAFGSDREARVSPYVLTVKGVEIQEVKQ